MNPLIDSFIESYQLIDVELLLRSYLIPQAKDTCAQSPIFAYHFDNSKTGFQSFDAVSGGSSRSWCQASSLCFLSLLMPALNCFKFISNFLHHCLRIIA